IHAFRTRKVKILEHAWCVRNLEESICSLSLNGRTGARRRALRPRIDWRRDCQADAGFPGQARGKQVSGGAMARHYPSDVAFTPAVKAVQSRKGSRASYGRMERGEGWQTTVTEELAEYLA